jgi:hypothetical protein
MNNPDHISKSLETIFWVKIFQFFDADPGWKQFRSGIQDPGWKKVGSGIRNTAFGCDILRREVRLKLSSRLSNFLMFSGRRKKTFLIRSKPG